MERAAVLKLHLIIYAFLQVFRVIDLLIIGENWFLKTI